MREVKRTPTRARATCHAGRFVMRRATTCGYAGHPDRPAIAHRALSRTGRIVGCQGCPGRQWLNMGSDVLRPLRPRFRTDRDADGQIRKCRRGTGRVPFPISHLARRIQRLPYGVGFGILRGPHLLHRWSVALLFAQPSSGSHPIGYRFRHPRQPISGRPCARRSYRSALRLGGQPRQRPVERTAGAHSPRRQ